MDENHFQFVDDVIEQNNNIIYKNYLDLNDEPAVPSLEESLKQCSEAFRLMTRNHYNKALNLCQKWSKKSLYHLHTKSLIQFVRAIMTLEKPEIETATKTCEQTQEFCSKVRRSGALGTLSKLVCRTDYNDYSDDEVHSELIHAEQQLMIALITFFGDQSLISLVKGTFRIRSCNTSYKECMTILERRTNWSSESSRMHFESGIRLGVGALNLVLSHLPQRVLKLLEFMGFSGSKSLGLEQLNQTADNENSLRHFLAELVVCAYECYMEQIFGLGKGNLKRVEQIVDGELNKFDKSAWFLWFKARTLQLKGQIDSAISVYEECLTVQSELKQLHNICFWELLWSHAVKCEWQSAAKYASTLGRQCHWSPATFAYQEATFLYMKMLDDNKHDMKKRITNLFRSVPSLRIRYAGKTLPPEKYCCVRTEKYFKQKETLILPAFELFYIWNIYSLVSNNQNLIQPMITRIDEEMTKFEKKGVCLKEMGLYSEAQTYFEKIIENEVTIKYDTFLPPEAALELGLTKLGMRSYQDSKYWLEKARKDYTGYPLETIVHFRVHCALQEIKSSSKLFV